MPQSGWQTIPKSSPWSQICHLWRGTASVSPDGRDQSLAVARRRIASNIARGRCIASNIEAMHRQQQSPASLARVHRRFSSCRPGFVVQIRSAKERRLTRLVRNRLRQRWIAAMRSGRGRTCSYTHGGDGGGEMLPSGEPPRSRIPFHARSRPREPHARIPSTQSRRASTMPVFAGGTSPRHSQMLLLADLQARELRQRPVSRFRRRGGVTGRPRPGVRRIFGSKEQVVGGGGAMSAHSRPRDAEFLRFLDSKNITSQSKVVTQ